MSTATSNKNIRRFILPLSSVELTSSVKKTKAETDYEDKASNPSTQCAVCEYFIEPNGCTKVQGSISPEGWCNLFEADSEKAGLHKYNDSHDERGRFSSKGVDFGIGGLAKAGKDNRDLNDKIEKYQTEQNRKQSSNWSKQELASANAYAWQGPNYHINGQARGILPPTPYGQEHIANLDSLLSKSITEKDLTVYRGINDAGLESIGSLEVGSSYTDKAFVSTSLSASHAAGFSEPWHEETPGALFKVLVPKGMRAAHLYDTAPEVLLPRNTKFTVTKVTDEPIKLSGELSTIKMYHVKASTDE